LRLVSAKVARDVQKPFRRDYHGLKVDFVGLEALISALLNEVSRI
jgi:hypothetical protein